MAPTTERTRQYQDWITRHARGDIRGQCAFWVQAMRRAFPELTPYQGLIARSDLPPTQGMAMVAGHWWLVTPTGTIVDPTARQFPWPFVYLPLPCTVAAISHEAPA